jgi:hypothetical protein
MSNQISEAVNGAGDVPEDVVSSIINIEDRIQRAAKIKDTAKALGVPSAAIKEEIKRRQYEIGDNKEGLPPEPEMWPQPISGAQLLNDIVAAAERHLILPEGAAAATALWVLFAHAHDCFEISPILTATSPTPECGKTTFAILLSGLTPRPLPGQTSARQ